MKKTSLRMLAMTIIIIAMFGSIVISAGSTEPYYTLRDNTIAASEIFEIEYINERFIAVGLDGIIKSSEDGIRWIGGTARSNSSLHGAAWGNGRYIVVGDFGTMLESTDAVKWSRKNGFSTDFRDIAYGKDKFIAVGSLGEIYYSSDGIRWMLGVSPVKVSLESIIWDGKQFVCVGDEGTIIRSADGLSWTIEKNIIKTKLRGIAWNGNIYVIAGDNGFIAASGDLENWIVSDSETKMALHSVAFGNGVFIASGGSGDYASGIIIYSKDGLDWSLAGKDLVNGYYGVAWGNGKFVAAGGSWGSMSVISSPDGEMWKEEFAGYNTCLYDIIKTQDKLVAVGNRGTILYSLDGKQWNSANSPTDRDIYSIAYGDDKYIAFTNEEALISKDGVNWSSVLTESYDIFSSAVWGNNRYVAVGVSGNILTSQDAKNWDKVRLGNGISFQGLAFGNGVFAALDQWGEIYTSQDGTNWTLKRFGDKSGNLELGYTSISFVKDGFIVTRDTTQNDSLIVSKDGELWTEVNMSPYNYDIIKDIAYGDGAYIAVGLNGTLLYSKDGLTWSNASGSYRNNLNGVVWNGDCFIAVGNNGNIINILKKNTAADIKSTAYRINYDKSAIENIPANTEIETFLTKVEMSEGAYYRLLQFDGLSNATSDILKSGMKFIVISEDKSKSKQYTLIVNKRTDTDLNSNAYIINNDKMIIEKVYAGTDYLKFMSSFKKSEGAVVKITYGNRDLISGLVYPGMKLTIIAEDGITRKTYNIGQTPPGIYINKQLISFKQTALLNNDTVIVSAEELAKVFGAAYAFDAKTGVIKISSKNRLIETSIGSKYAKASGKEIKMPCDIKMIGVPYISVKFLAENFGYQYKYDSASNNIYLTKK